MLHIHIVCLGRLKEKYWREAEAEYLKRLSAFVKVDIVELREESFNNKGNPDAIKKKEAEKILGAIKKYSDAPLVILDEHGKQFSSPELAAELTRLSASEIIFVIGGPLGLHANILSRAVLKLSLSRLTFTHQMARIFLAEQLYRAMMINAGRKYHY